MGGDYLVWEGKENFRGFRGIDLAYTNADLKISLYVRVHIKKIP